MKIISVLSCKGGVGKSTIVSNIIRLLKENNKNFRILISDLDPQQTLKKWTKRIKEGSNLILFPSDKNPINHLKKISDFDYLIIDTPPYKLSFLEEIANKSDQIFLIMKPSFLDFESIKSLLPLINLEKVILLINQIDFRSSEYKRYLSLFKNNEDLSKIQKIILVPSSISYVRNFEKGTNMDKTRKELKELNMSLI